MPLSNTTSGIKTQNLTIASATLSDSGEYYCFVINQWKHKVYSNYAAVTILSK